MSSTFTAEKITRIRDGARGLEERAVAHEEQLEFLVETAEADLRHLTAALSQQHPATQIRLDHLEVALDVHSRRSQNTLDLARRLRVSAREAHLAASRVVSDLRNDNEDERSQWHAGRHAVLIADDHDDSRELMSLLLNEAGFIVRTASNGLQAVIAAYEMQPTVIVMDVTMPVLDGVEATRLIKAIDAIRDARVIAHTARPEMDDTARKLFAAVLKKPVPPDVLLATVQQCVTDLTPRQRLEGRADHFRHQSSRAVSIPH